MRNGSTVWVANDSVYKFHLQKTEDPNTAMCGTSLDSMWAVRVVEALIPSEERCKICWRISNREQRTKKKSKV